MKTKNRYIGLVIAGIAVLFQSCLKDQEDIFNKSASARLDEYLAHAQSVLVGAENGWSLDYYPESNQVYGGFMYAIKFTADQAQIMSEVDPGQTETSLYKMGKDNGPMISFDSYNSFMHYFATPSSSMNEGYQGDFEFVIDSVGVDVLKLHGKRSHNVMYLHKLNESAQNYSAKVIKMIDQFYLLEATGTIGNGSAVANFNTSDRQITITQKDGAKVSAAYNYTDRGIRLYRPLSVNGVLVSEIAYDNDLISMSAPDLQLNKCAVNPQIVTDVIKNIGSNDVAFNRSFTIDKLDQFNFSTDADWLTLKINGNVITIAASENTTGEVRSAKVRVINKINNQYTETFSVSQCDIRDVLGSYSLFFYDYENKLENIPASIIQSGKGYALLTTIEDTELTFGLTFDQSSAAFRMPSCQNIGTYKGYGIFNMYMFDNEERYTSVSTNFSCTIPFEHDDELGTYAIIGEQLLYENMPTGFTVDKITLMASEVTPPTSASDFLGYINTMTSPILVKSNGENAVASAKVPLRMKAPHLPKYLKRINY